jgi:hypothetical protein
MREHLRRGVWVVVWVGTIWGATVAAQTPEHHGGQGSLQLSHALMDLVRAEMREITSGVQRLPVAMATGDWATIVETSRNIKRSYLMEQQLTEPQRQELRRQLPEDFQRFDQRFHAEAARLGVAATQHDPVLTAFYFSRLLEMCMSCHAAYARARFPGVAVPPPASHQH